MLVTPNGVSSGLQFEISVSDKKQICINVIGTLYKTRQQWQRQVHQTKGLISIDNNIHEKITRF